MNEVAALPPLAVYRRMLGYMLPHWRVFAASVLAMAGFSAAEVSFLALVKPLVDGSFVDKDPAVIRWMPAAIVGLFIVRGLLGFASNYGMAWISRVVIKTLRGELFNHMLLLPVGFYDRARSGQLVTRLTYHVEQVAGAVSTAFNASIKGSLTTIGTIGYMAWLNLRLTLFVLIVGPIVAVVVRYVSRRFRAISKRIQESVGSVTEAADELVSAQRVIKVHNGQALERASFERINERHRWLSLKQVATKEGSAGTLQMIGAFAIAAVVYFATQPENLAVITAGTFVSFAACMLSLLGPLRNLTNVNETVQRGITAATAVFQTLDQPPEPAGGTRPLLRAQGRLEFAAVRFRYAPELPEALRGVDLIIEPAQTVALVGRSGGGKSTLLSLLPRFYDPTAGAIRLDGHDLREYPVQQLRAQMALVDQHVRLFNASVAENIAYGLDPVPPEDRIVEAARAAYAWEFIEKLPQGLRTPIGQNGVMLSGGQRQRIAIARALLRDAPILLLDEATSALDTESERYIQQALERLVKGRTTLVIAHRLSTVQRADRIMVMEQGQVVEAGAHAELLAKNGLYAALHRMQFEEA